MEALSTQSTELDGERSLELDLQELEAMDAPGIWTAVGAVGGASLVSYAAYAGYVGGVAVT